jgi:phytoene dehydrogenase-like protein
MADARDIVLIGGGHNALVAAFYLARAGLKPLVLERRATVGGVAVTEEFHPGFRCSTVLHTAGSLLPAIARDMRLERHGYEIVCSDIAATTLLPDGRALVLHTDPAKSAGAIRQFSARDAAQFAEFHSALARIGKAIHPLLSLTPLDMDKPAAQELWNFAKLGRGVRKLGKKEMLRLLRWGPMSVADFAAEWFESEPLRAAIAARAVFGLGAGPRSPGTTAPLLLRVAADGYPAGHSLVPRGGLGALTQAMAAAAKKAGAVIRTDAEVAQILVKDVAVRGVVLTSGEEIAAKTVVSGADPKRTLLRLVDPVHFDPGFLSKLQHYRSNGVVAKLNLALDGLPEFAALRNASAALAGRILIAPDSDYIERAFDASKYGEFSQQPYLEITIPSLTDPSLAPAGKHVMSIHVQYAPYRLKSGDWPGQRNALAETVLRTLAEYAPDLPGRVIARQVLSPQDLEDTYGLTGGHIFHGELSLDQLFTMRPLLGWARYRTPLRGLYLCGSGTHPGIVLSGASGFNASREVLKDSRR